MPQPIFYRTLEKVDYEQGFFNVIREFDHDVRLDEGPITLVLRGLGAIDAYVDRSANGNGTARIRNARGLLEWFQANYMMGDEVPVRFDSPFVLTLGEDC